MKQKTFKLNRIVKVIAYVTDEIEVEADSLEEALAIAEEDNEDEGYVLYSIDTCNLEYGIEKVDIDSDEHDGEPVEIYY